MKSSLTISYKLVVLSNLRITHYFNIYLTICFSYLKNIIISKFFKDLYNLKIITDFSQIIADLVKNQNKPENKA